MSANTAIIAHREILNLPIDKIRPNPNQPRRVFDQGSLNELAESIRTYGVMQPVSVRLTAGYGYELVAGERRLRASKQLGMATIPAIVVNISDTDSALIAIIENMQRENLNFVEEALGYQAILADYGFTQEELAARIGKSQSSIANKIRILRLSHDTLSTIIDNNLTERHARALLKLPDEKTRARVLSKIIENDLNVRKTEELVENVINSSAKSENKPKKFTPYIRDIRIFTNTIRQALEVMKMSGMGTMYEMNERDFGYEIRIELHNANAN